MYFVIKAENTENVVIAPAKEAITEPEPPENTITTNIPNAEVVEQPKPQIPPKPVMSPEVAAFPRLQKVKVTLDKHNHLIFEAERERTKLEIELSDLKGLARLTKKNPSMRIRTWTDIVLSYFTYSASILFNILQNSSGESYCGACPHPSTRENCFCGALIML